jgi:glycosyltransferase involved in cell wall biosynthesis
MVSPLPRVVVLLSTYNGARYLPAQLDSLRAQESVTVELHVRDDGSTDDTLKVLASYASVWPNLATVQSGPNLRPAASFLELIRTAPPGADFYAFCDQDDVWLPNKLARAAAALANDAGPALYCSNVICVDENLEELGVPFQNDDARFEHIVFENIVYGCTSVLNREAYRLVASRLPTGGVIMHDWWCALVISAFGRIAYDPTPCILYRQHGANSIGARVSLFSERLQQLRRLMKDPRNFCTIEPQAREFSHQFGAQLKGDHAEFVARLIDAKSSLVARIRYAVFGRVVRAALPSNLVTRVLIAVGWY